MHKNSYSPHLISIKEARHYAKELHARIDALGISAPALEYHSRLSHTTLKTVLSGQRLYKQATLEQLKETLDYLEESVQQGNDITSPTERWGAKIMERRQALGLSLGALGSQVGLTKERIRQIEAGIFKPEQLNVKQVLLALGYPRAEMDTLDHDSPAMPEWLAQRNQQAQAVADATQEQKKHIAEAFHALRTSREISHHAFKEHTHSASVKQIESARTYSQDLLDKSLGAFRMESPDQLIQFVKDNGIEVPNARKLQDRLELLYAASRILRTHWNIPAKEMEQHCAPHYKVSEASFLGLENPNGAFGNEKHLPSLHTIIGVVAALFNADQQQPGEYRTLDASMNVKRIAELANSGKPFTHTKLTRRFLTQAIDDIVESALEVENKIYQDAPRHSHHGYLTGLRHSNHADTPTLAELIASRQPERSR